MRARACSFRLPGDGLPALAAVLVALLCLCLAASPVLAQPEAPTAPFPALSLGVRGAESPQDVALTLQIVALMTVLSVAPALVLMLTSFTRILIVLGFVRNALGLQQTPPNQVLVTLALFLALFTMGPVWTRVYDGGLGPYMRGETTSLEAWAGTVKPVRDFMLSQTREGELSLMITMADLPQPRNADEVPLQVLVPAFMLSELKTAFQMGVVIFVPFIVVDMIVASVLMSMGMIMLPPMMISLPFKVLLFVMADGWNLVVVSLLNSFR
ncbi:flagellar type III secretion system pore protein FliP [Aminithiophilus ramosus]|uniref:Flagellar biosynthetic protein FliP n=2 Tax=Synergistales TaxID=649776 RepID=A0A9Q7AAI2_9BACT|nr:flagellar type III secretion system pore protein FliP [Aminithiophilus ramosus]QTX31653.1 flagellar type III secretion system pore protein FliP [Aminithiophilus ramosus]QVL35459.1 flagellar type III secretion system pore protein FliP [Synergistota bacterium]